MRAARISTSSSTPRPPIRRKRPGSSRSREPPSAGPTRCSQIRLQRRFSLSSAPIRAPPGRSNSAPRPGSCTSPHRGVESAALAAERDRMRSFVPRLLFLTLVWLLATAALTFAAAQRMGPGHVTAATTKTTVVTAQRVLVVPDVRKQAYVFAKGTLGDAGFAWRVRGSVQGYSANTVGTQSPLAGTRVVDTGAPLV